ncbi:DUF2666 family protein [Thermococcus sp.]|uniref:DUF2666 family protein n=1 Tax=Thermococcus sp. TaxID=35749 RepID=UPI002601DBD0|nr:DUF2666 family protein [Thermococcus sp.]
MRVEDHIAFTARHLEWEVAKRLTEMDDERIALFLSAVSNSVNGRIPFYFGEILNVDGLISLANELRRESLTETVALLKSPGTARKLGALVGEKDKKLKKLIVDAAKALLVRETLREIAPVDYPGGSLKGVDTEFPFSEPHVNFTAKHRRWIVVKRLIIDEKTPMLDVARLLASINETTSLKIPAYAGIDIEGIESEFPSKKAKKEDIPKVIEAYETLEVEAFAQKPFIEHARVFALRTALGKVGLPLDVPSKNLEKYLEKKG